MTAGASATPARRGRRAVAVVGLALLLLLVGLALRPGQDRRAFDPASTDGDGTRALSQVLDRSGVSVRSVGDLATLRGAGVDRDVTLVVADAEMLSPSAVDELARSHAGRLVLLSPSDAVLERLHLPVRAAPSASSAANATVTSGEHDASCRTDDVDPTDTLVAPDAEHYILDGAQGGHAFTCFVETAGDDEDGGRARGGALVDVAAGDDHPETVVLGAPTVLTNARITAEDDSAAALGLRLLGHRKHVLWYLPTPEVDGAPVGSGPAVVPPWFVPGVAILAAAVLAVCLWRGRRFGPLSTEPLPAVVPAIETVHARARLYARSRDASHALGVLQRGTLARLRHRLGLPAGTPEETIVERVAATIGGDAEAVRRDLTDPSVTPSHLTTRAARLRRIEREVDDA